MVGEGAGETTEDAEGTENFFGDWLLGGDVVGSVGECVGAIGGEGVGGMVLVREAPWVVGNLFDVGAFPVGEVGICDE